MNTKDMIVEKTLKLILEKGTIDISISEIRNCTGLTTGGIYYHFSDKSDIFDAILQKYMVDYIKVDFDKLILEGSTKDRIHDVFHYILNHVINGVEIEKINEKINYESVVLLLTPAGYAHDDVNLAISQLGHDIRKLLTDIVDEGKRQNEIRKDFATENIVESLYTMYMGVQSYWLTFANDDIDLILDRNFEMAWRAIEYQ